MPQVNPYAAPIAAAPSKQADHLNTGLPWLRWIIGSAVLESLLTIGVESLDAAVETPAPTGVIIAVISACGLFTASVVAGKRYLPWNSQSLLQLVNTTVWMTMLITVWQLVPLLRRNQSLSHHASSDICRNMARQQCLHGTYSIRNTPRPAHTPGPDSRINKLKTETTELNA